jgi:hypothetical protein
MVRAALRALTHDLTPDHGLIARSIQSVIDRTGADRGQANEAVLVAACIIFPDRKNICNELRNQVPSLEGYGIQPETASTMQRAVRKMQGIAPVSWADLAKLGPIVVHKTNNPRIPWTLSAAPPTQEEMREKDEQGVQEAVSKVIMWRRGGLVIWAAAAAALALGAAYLSLAPAWVVPGVFVAGLLVQKAINDFSDRFGSNVLKTLGPTRDRLTPIFNEFGTARHRSVGSGIAHDAVRGPTAAIETSPSHGTSTGRTGRAAARDPSPSRGSSTSVAHIRRRSESHRGDHASRIRRHDDPLASSTEAATVRRKR